jgi:hypothetical protein
MKPVIALLVFTLVSMSAGRAVGEADCKSTLFGLCTSRYSNAEQAEINAGKRLEAILRDPAKAGPELERRLRQQIRYADGLRLIQEPLLGEVIVRPATVEWSVSCSFVGIAVTLGGNVEHGTGTEVVLAPVGTTINKAACPAISIAVGQAMLRITTGQ